MCRSHVPRPPSPSPAVWLCCKQARAIALITDAASATNDVEPTPPMVRALHCFACFPLCSAPFCFSVYHLRAVCACHRPHRALESELVSHFCTMMSVFVGIGVLLRTTGCVHIKSIVFTCVASLTSCDVIFAAPVVVRTLTCHSHCPLIPPVHILCHFCRGRVAIGLAIAMLPSATAPFSAG